MMASIVYLCFGLPAQILKNYKRKTTEGLSIVLVLLCACTLVLWSSYAWAKDPRDWYILGSNVPGLIFALVLLSQFWLYRKKEEE